MCINYWTIQAMLKLNRMLFSSLALAVVAAAAVPWVQQEEVGEGVERGASACARCSRVLAGCCM
jgi:hypothetical protein